MPKKTATVSEVKGPSLQGPSAEFLYASEHELPIAIYSYFRSDGTHSDLWDKLIESQQLLELADYLHRVHSLCFHIRLWEDSVSVVDRQREALMAEQIQVVRDEVAGPLLVVTGGYHSSTLAARREGWECAARLQRAESWVLRTCMAAASKGQEFRPSPVAGQTRSGTAAAQADAHHSGLDRCRNLRQRFRCAARTIAR